MRVLLFGADGFVGRNVADTLRTDGHEVVGSYREDQEGREGYAADLLDPEAVGNVLVQVQPDVVINCTGVIKNDESARANPRHTENILSQIVASKLVIKRVVIMGSAAEYGVVDVDGPVSEDAPLLATAPYGVSKVDEVKVAQRYRDEHGLSVVAARIFNPIGSGMSQQQLVPRIITQIDAVERGEKEAIEISRLGSKRDYVTIKDTAKAIALLATGPEPQHGVYNVGSGKATTNGELIGLVLKACSLEDQVPIKETMDQPEPNYASQADISRLREEFGWEPQVSLEDTVKRIVEDARKQ